MRRRGVAVRLQGEPLSPTGPPAIELRAEGEHRTLSIMQVAVHRHRLTTLPALHGSDIAPQVRGDSLPGIKPVLVLRPADRGAPGWVFVTVIQGARPGFAGWVTAILAPPLSGRQITASGRNGTGRLTLPSFAVLCCLPGRTHPPSLAGRDFARTATGVHLGVGGN